MRTFARTFVYYYNDIENKVKRVIQDQFITIRLTGRVREESLTSQQRDELLRLFKDWQKNWVLWR